MPLTKIDDRGLNTPVDLLDNEKIRLGTGNDVELYHNGTHSFVEATGQLRLCGTTNVVTRASAFGEVMINAIADGAVELYHNGTKKLETTSGGVLIPNGNIGSVPAGNGTASGVSLDTTGGDIFTGRVFIQGYQKHADSDFLTGINNNGPQVVLYDYSNSKHLQKWNKNGSTELNYSGSKRFETTSAGTKNTGVLDCTGSIVLTDQSGDNIGKLRLGNNNDLEIYHIADTTNVISGAGPLTIQSNDTTSGVSIQTFTDGETMAKFIKNGAVSLYFDNSPKLATDATGVTVTGNLAMSGELNMTNGGNYNRFIDCSLDDNEALFIRSTNGGDANHQYMALFHRGAAVELYHAAAKKFETFANGIKAQDLASAGAYVNVVTNAGSQGSLYGTANTLGLLDGQNHYMVKGIKDAGVELYNDNEKKFATGSNGVYHDNNGTLNQNQIHFERGNNTGDFSTVFGVTNNPDCSGYSDQDDGYWNFLSSKGGTIIVLNSDGAASSGRNNHDHFSIYQKAGESTNGRRLFSVDNIGAVQFGLAGVKIDREWANQPAISVQRDCNDGTNNTDDSAYFRFHGTSQTHSSWTGAGATGADFSVNLLIDGTTYGTSDRRAKTDIVDCPYGLDVVNKLQPRKFQLVNSQLTPQGDDNINLGFIAQEIKEHIPECVNYLGDEENIPNDKGWARAYALDIGEVIPVLTKAIQELSDKVKTLETKVAALEAK